MQQNGARLPNSRYKEENSQVWQFETTTTETTSVILADVQKSLNASSYSASLILGDEFSIDSGYLQSNRNNLARHLICHPHLSNIDVSSGPRTWGINGAGISLLMAASQSILLNLNTLIKLPIPRRRILCELQTVAENVEDTY